MLYLGIDPGQSGGLALIDYVGNHSAVLLQPMPETERDVWDWITANVGDETAVAMIEQVHTMPGQGIASSGKFMQGYGFLRGCLTAAGIPFEAVRPQQWIKGLDIPQRARHTKTKRVQVSRGKNKGEWRNQKYGGETDREWKTRLKAHAQQLFPKAQVTLATADALLIAEYCRRKNEGLLQEKKKR